VRLQIFLLEQGCPRFDESFASLKDFVIELLTEVGSSFSFLFSFSDMI